MPDWDVAYCAHRGARSHQSAARRRVGHLPRVRRADAVGFITYSEGCNDDVNKIVWSSLGWDPEATVIDILRQYSQYFLGGRNRERCAQGLLALERNWRGPLQTNESVYATLKQFQETGENGDAARSPELALPAGIVSHLLRCLRAEPSAVRDSARRPGLGAAPRGQAARRALAMKGAEAILDRCDTEKVAADWCARVHELAEALYQSIRMQLNVERYKAIAVGRGANLDTIDVPLNNRRWLKRRFAELRQLDSESERLTGIGEIVNWTNPGPGGFYDDLGNPSYQPHLVRGQGFAKDPAFLHPRSLGFTIGRNGAFPGARTQNRSMMPRCRCATAVWTRKRSTRSASSTQATICARIRLVANGTTEIHSLQGKPSPVRPVEFEIPKSATAKGELELSWYQEPGRGGSGARLPSGGGLANTKVTGFDGYSGAYTVRPPSTGRQRPGHEIIVDEEQHRLGDVSRRTFAFHEGSVDSLPLLVGRQVRRQQDRAGQDAIHTDTRIASAELHGQAARQGRDRSLGRKIGRIVEQGRATAQSPRLTMQPPSGCFTIASPACWAQRKVPSVFVSKWNRTSALVTSSSGLGFQTAAQLTSTSRRPNWSSTWWIKPRTASCTRRLAWESDDTHTVGLKGRNRFGSGRRRGEVMNGQGVATLCQGLGDIPADAPPATAGHQSDAFDIHERLPWFRRVVRRSSQRSPSYAETSDERASII